MDATEQKHFHLLIAKPASLSASVCTFFALLVWKTHPGPAQMEVCSLHLSPGSPPNTPLGDIAPSITPFSPASSFVLFQLEYFHEHTNFAKVFFLENPFLVSSFLPSRPLPFSAHFLSKTYQKSGSLEFAFYCLPFTLP